MDPASKSLLSSCWQVYFRLFWSPRPWVNLWRSFQTKINKTSSKVSGSQMQHILFTFLIFIFRDHYQIYPAHRRQMIDLPIYHSRRHWSRHVILFILSMRFNPLRQRISWYFGWQESDVRQNIAESKVFFVQSTSVCTVRERIFYRYFTDRSTRFAIQTKARRSSGQGGYPSRSSRCSWESRLHKFQ